MVERRRAARLTSGELERRELLWRTGGATLAEAHRQIGRRLGHTTVQTPLNRLVEKGLAARSEDRPARYRPAVVQSAVSGSHLDLLVQRFTAGSVLLLVADLVHERDLSSAEIEVRRQPIDEAERRQIRTSPRGKGTA